MIQIHLERNKMTEVLLRSDMQRHPAAPPQDVVFFVAAAAAGSLMLVAV